MYPQHTWFEGAADEWTRYYELNVVVGVRLIQEFVPEMKRAGWGFELGTAAYLDRLFLASATTSVV